MLEVFVVIPKAMEENVKPVRLTDLAAKSPILAVIDNAIIHINIENPW